MRLNAGINSLFYMLFLFVSMKNVASDFGVYCSLLLGVVVDYGVVVTL